jgi:hypothetical protein
MKTSLPGRGAAAVALVLVALGLSASPGQAQYPPSNNYPGGQPCYVVRVAPDMCGGYFYCTNGCTWYGPSYCVYPPFPPVGGLQPGQQTDCSKGPAPTPYQFYQKQAPMGPGGIPAPPGVALPYNPWMRSPRDFFMWNEAQQEVLTRQQRPAFVP